MGGWADVWELWVEPARRRHGVGTWLVAHAAAWLRLGGCGRIPVSVASEELDQGVGRFLARFGWRQIGCTRRAWTRSPSTAGAAHRAPSPPD